ncbi:hypothetical protein [Roseateles sp. BYS87W]|uniref:Uncharacterized protein n=1 Tax=Pelomonas baiyunensis TaxID=3299026 RepID=A0ABW7H035_9BURK
MSLRLASSLILAVSAATLPALAGTHAAAKAGVQQDKQKLAIDKAQLKADKAAGNKTAVAADKAAIQADKQQLDTDRAAGKGQTAGH